MASTDPVPARASDTAPARVAALLTAVWALRGVSPHTEILSRIGIRRPL
jgi:hypothetical protein